MFIHTVLPYRSSKFTLVLINHSLSELVLVSLVVVSTVFNSEEQGDYNRFLLTVPDRTDLVFGLAAGSDGHIGLSEHPGISTRNMYEIVLGGWDNQRSAIRRSIQGDILAEASTVGILDRNNINIFWISWLDGIIKLGSGSVVGNGLIVEYRDPSPYKVNSVAMTTSSGYTGTWALGRVSGEYTRSVLVV